MQEDIKISMFEVVGSPLCVASDDGQKVHDRLDTALRANQDVILSFRDVTALTGAFLNAAVGQLYGIFDEEKIQTSLRVEEAEPKDLALLDRVIRNAKLYFEDPKNFNQAVREVMGDEDDGE